MPVATYFCIVPLKAHSKLRPIIWIVQIINQLFFMKTLLFSENVKILRENEGLKQANMLDIIGFPRSTWNNYERGASMPNVEDLIKISHFFGVLESDLLHTEVAESDMHELYNRYMALQNQPFKIGNTPRAKAFKTYFEAFFIAIPGIVNPDLVTESVTNDVTNATKKPKKGMDYPIGTDLDKPLILNEPRRVVYISHNADEKTRIAHVERALEDISVILQRYLQHK
jgi:transcriptional regulator with XRE-family HTH domain